MTVALRVNFMSGNLSLASAIGATTLSAAGFAALPVVAAPDVLEITLDPEGTPELVTVTAHTSGATSVTTTPTALAHASGTAWVHAPVADDFEDTPSALAVRYAAPWGSDNADGLTWKNAKQHVMSAYDALPSTGGTVMFADGTQASGTGTDHGIWIAGSSDPNYSSLPSGWRQAKRVQFVGAGGSINTRRGTQAVIHGGSASDGTKPAVALSCFDSLTFENGATDAVFRPIRVGMMSNGTTQNTGFLSGTFWRNFNGRVGGGAGAGPNVSIESTVSTQFWHHMEWCDMQGNNAAAVGTEQRQVIVCTGAYLVTIDHAVWTYGTMKYTTPTTSWNLRVNDVQGEGDFTNPIAPLVDIYGSQTAGFAFISYCSVFDAPGTPAVVRNNAALLADCVVTLGIGESGTVAVRGPHTSLGFERVQDGSLEVSKSHGPTRYKDVARRNFGMAMTPAATQYANHAPTAWTGRSHGLYPAGGNATVTARTGFNGVPNATGRLTWAGGAGTYGYRECQANMTLAVGDFIAFGVWMDNVVAGDDGSSGPSLTLSTTGFAANSDIQNVLGLASSQFISCLPQTFGVGNRPSPTWYVVLCRVTAIGTNPCSVVGELACPNGGTRDYQGPVLYQFPGSSWTAEAVASYVNAMQSIAYLPNLLSDDGVGGDLVAPFGARPVFPGSYLVVADQDPASGGFFGTPLGSGVFYKATAGHRVRLAAAGVFPWDLIMRTQSSTGDRLRFANGSADFARAELSTDAADGETEFLVTRNIGGTKTLQRVSMGAADSGGTGFKLLRVPN